MISMPLVAGVAAVKHGLSAGTVVLLDDEDAAALAALEPAARAELAPRARSRPIC